VIKRSQGIQYQVGAELRGIMDAIRNDGIRSNYINYLGTNNYSYSYYTDPLDYRRAVVGNVLAGITYTNIRNFEYGFRARIGGEKHVGIKDQLFYKTYTLFGNEYDSKWEPYSDRTSANVNIVNRVNYKIGFRKSWDDWRKSLNILNNLEINPQYKVQFTYKHEVEGPAESIVDPRKGGGLERHFRMDYNGDGKVDSDYDNFGNNLEHAQDERILWELYSSRNQKYLLSVPIIRASYKIAEQTQFQFGYQWLKYTDFITPEENLSSNTLLWQIVSKSNYRGYSVTLFVGANFSNAQFDINQKDPVLEQGNMFDIHGYELFVKVFSGI
jgi:hypothetical protein